VLDVSVSNVAAKVPFLGLSSKTTRFPRMQSAVTIVRGVTKPQTLCVTFDADPLAQVGKPVSFIGTTTIDRRHYGMNSYQLVVGNKVRITLKARMVPR